MATIWFSNPSGLAKIFNLLNISNTSDRSGSIDVPLLYPGIVPANALSLILTVERGYLATPPASAVVSLRLMPDGYSLKNVLDRAKEQQRLGGTFPGLDVIAEDVRMPIVNGVQKFFYALQSSDPGAANKMAIIDLWGYEI